MKCFNNVWDWLLQKLEIRSPFFHLYFALIAVIPIRSLQNILYCILLGKDSVQSNTFVFITVFLGLNNI